ncbi:MAG: helix-turn-helix transcriptional regulator [Solirubrobacteraceae bacterium]|nr:helix-turn-helix transcriptional regulator [Solirubrobacteraceae bacterium]
MTATRTFTVQARVGAARRAATRERILDAARRMLERGDSVAALTVSKLASEAEVSRATFYLHFPDKRHLIEALHDTAVQDWHDIAGDAIADPDITRDQLQEIMSAGLRTSLSHAPVFAGIIELAEYDPEVREAWRENMRSASATTATWILAIRPELGDRKAAVLAEAMTWTSERSVQQMLGVRGSASCDVDELAGALTEIWWCVTHPAEP